MKRMRASGLCLAVLVGAGMGQTGAIAAAGAPVPTTASAVSSATAPNISGRVMGLVAGDTLLVRSAGKTVTVRLIGVDTPDMSTKQCWSAQAKEYTRTLVGGQVVTLRADRRQADRDELGRLMRHVVLQDGTSLGQRLLSNGYAREKLTGRTYAGRPTYLQAQASAKAKPRGLWRGCATAPKAKTKAATKAKIPARRPTPPAPKGCVIKGNISDSGERIYHVPGQRYYNATKIDRRKGERMFCSVADAQRAGWRPAKV